MKLSLFITACLIIAKQSLQGQPASYYIKVSPAVSAEAVLAEMKNVYPEAEFSIPFPGIAFDGLNRVIRADRFSPEYMAEKQASLWEKTVSAEPVPRSIPFYTPDDLGVELGSPNQWYHYKIKSKNGWDISRGDNETLIAIVDNAFLDDHPELSGKIGINASEIPNDGLDNDGNGYTDDYAGWNARNNSGNVYVQSTNSGHGTHVAGIAAAQTDNGSGMASMGFDCFWLPVKAGDASDVITHGYEGIAFAATRGAKIINCSWGSFDSSSTAKSVINFALEEGCLIVAAAGNFANETPLYPATYRGVISVAATTQSDTKLNISSFGSRIDISAPGSGIWSTSRNATGAPTFEFLSGTSQAAPLVSGTLGLMKSLAPEAPDTLILSCLYDTSTPIDNIPANAAYNGLLGSGRLHAGDALNCLYTKLGLQVSGSYGVEPIFLFPNPADDLFYFFTEENDLISWQLLTPEGKWAKSGRGSCGSVEDLPSGVYFFRGIHPKNGVIFNSKLMVIH
jgi:subtilisin family serine protease